MAVTSHLTSLDDLLSQSRSIPENTTREAACCCGRPSCAYLTHNNAALDDLEKDVRMAAQLGQALLVRHETYMAEAEESRRDMSTRIECLETEKKNLEVENARTIQENRSLLDQLEDLNSTIADSETHVKSLEATLQSTQMELRRLEALAARTYDLEIQLATLELEQINLQRLVSTSEADERSAIQRWKKAERDLHEVQEQLEKIEREAKEEKERHVEVVGRMERQRIVEKELDSAAGRLKGAAAATTLGQGKNGSNVVSHFVKDILQDNANLQLGIVELREMLLSSNDEVETLREQLMLHQPMPEEDDIESGPSTLRAELAPKEPVTSQELHIHHHYHTPAKKEDIRRPKKKRNVITPSLFTPPSGSQYRDRQIRPSPASAAAAILSHTAITIPNPTTPGNRWSMQSAQTASDFAASSAPSSPQSTYRYSNLFDRGFVEQSLDFSRPTSPGSSVDPLSPVFKPHHRKNGSEYSMRSFATPNPFNPEHVIKEEEDDDVLNLSDLHDGTSRSTSNEDGDQSMPSLDSEEPDSSDDVFSPYSFQPKLRRSTSHESILSISGIDIHTLKSRPSQITITGSGAMLRPRARNFNISNTSFTSTQPILSSSAAIAQPTLSRQGHDSTSYLRSFGLPERPASRTSNSSAEATPKRIGAWVWNRWAVTPTSSPSSANSRTQTPDPINLQRRAVSTPAVDPLRAMMGRPPGINQKGPIPGLRRPEKTPSRVMPDIVDREALREVLEE